MQELQAKISFEDRFWISCSYRIKKKSITEGKKKKSKLSSICREQFPRKVFYVGLKMEYFLVILFHFESNKI